MAAGLFVTVREIELPRQAGVGVAVKPAGAAGTEGSDNVTGPA